MAISNSYVKLPEGMFDDPRVDVVFERGFYVPIQRGTQTPQPKHEAWNSKRSNR